MMRSILTCIALVSSSGIAAADSAYPSSSIYHLNATLTDQAGAAHSLEVFRGHPVLITMFYGSCSHTCPLLIETVRAVERAAPNPADLRVLMISIDPARDTPEALAKIARERRIDASRWMLASTDAATVRKIAAVLNIQYKQGPDGELNHSSVIAVLTPEGEIAAQSAMLGKADEPLLASLREIGTAR